MLLFVWQQDLQQEEVAECSGGASVVGITLVWITLAPAQGNGDRAIGAMVPIPSQLSDWGHGVSCLAAPVTCHCPQCHE